MADSNSTERDRGGIQDDMSMIQSHGPQDTDASPAGMSFMSPFDPQSFAASIAPATMSNGDLRTASTQADRLSRGINRRRQQPGPQSSLNRVGQPTSAQDSRQQSVMPVEDAWGFVSSPQLQTTDSPSPRLIRDPQVPRIQAGPFTTSDNGESQLPPLENSSSNMNYMERPSREALLRAGFLESGSAERHQHSSDPNVTVETLSSEQEDMRMIQSCEHQQAHATTGGVDFMLPFEFESCRNPNTPASTSSGSDIDAAQIGHTLANSNRE